MRDNRCNVAIVRYLYIIFSIAEVLKKYNKFELYYSHLSICHTILNECSIFQVSLNSLDFSLFYLLKEKLNYSYWRRNSWTITVLILFDIYSKFSSLNLDTHYILQIYTYRYNLNKNNLLWYVTRYRDAHVLLRSYTSCMSNIEVPAVSSTTITYTVIQNGDVRSTSSRPGEHSPAQKARL